MKKIDRERISDMYENGMSNRDISNETGFKFTTVCLYTKTFKEGFDKPYDRVKQKIKARGYSSVHEYHKELLAKRGFEDATSYKDYLAKNLGFKSRHEYEDYCMRKRGFSSRAEYRREKILMKYGSYSKYVKYLYKEAGCKTRKEYEDKKAKRRGFKNNRELLDHLAAKKGFKSYNEYWKKLTKGKNRKAGKGKVSRLEKQLENNMYINKKENRLELLDILYDALGKGDSKVADKIAKLLDVDFDSEFLLSISILAFIYIQEGAI